MWPNAWNHSGDRKNTVDFVLLFVYELARLFGEWDQIYKLNFTPTKNNIVTNPNRSVATKKPTRIIPVCLYLFIFSKQLIQWNTKKHTDIHTGSAQSCDTDNRTWNTGTQSAPVDESTSANISCTIIMVFAEGIHEHSVFIEHKGIRLLRFHWKITEIPAAKDVHENASSENDKFCASQIRKKMCSKTKLKISTAEKSPKATFSVDWTHLIMPKTLIRSKRATQ